MRYPSPVQRGTAVVVCGACLVLCAGLHGADAPGSPAPAPGGAADAQAAPIVVEGNLDAARNQILPALGASTYDIGRNQLADQSQGMDAPFNQVLLRAPGVAQDSFGQLHVRGEHANLQYRIDDVLLPEGITGFGQELDTRFADNVTFITGSLPAQYGFRTAGVVDIWTRNGAAHPGGAVSVYGGSFDTLRLTAQGGGTVGDVDAFGLASYTHTALGIENPTDARTAIHDDSDQYRGFARVSRLLDPSSRLTLLVSATDSTYEIPNNPGQDPVVAVPGAPDSAHLDERQRQRGAYGVVAYQRSTSGLDYQAAAFVRDSALRFDPDRLGDLAFTGVASMADLRSVSAGLQLDASLQVNDQHTLRAGASSTIERAVADTSTEVFPVDAGGTVIGPAFTVVDDHHKVGQMSGIYLQDAWTPTANWTINYGARFDSVDAYVHESQLSPRLNTTLSLGDTTFHAGYARYFTPPPLESVPQETVAKFDGTTNAAANDQNDPVRSERAHYVDVGVSQRIGPHAQIGLDGYYKRAQHQLDDGQFGSAVIFTPFNYAHGTVYGAELTGSYQDDVWSAYANLAVSRATGRDIESAQFEFDPAELAYIHDHDVYLDHDQRYTASAGVAYRLPLGLRLTSDLLYGSGLRQGFANTEKMPMYVTADAGIAYASHGLTLRFDVVNLLDRSYELRDGSGIGVGAPQFGQRRGFYGGMDYAF